MKMNIWYVAVISCDFVLWTFVSTQTPLQNAMYFRDVQNNFVNNIFVYVFKKSINVSTFLKIEP